MAFSQWTKFGSVTATLITTNPLEGASSLVLGMGSSTADGGMGLTSGAAITTGRVRSMVQVLNDNSSAGIGCFGMLQSFATNVDAYWVTKQGSSASIRIQKTNVNSVGTTTGQLGSNGSLGYSVTVNSIFALELKWQRDPDTGFIVLTARASASLISSPSTYDYSDLQTLITVTDISPLTSGISAGVGVGGSSSGNIARFDDTQIFRV